MNGTEKKEPLLRLEDVSTRFLIPQRILDAARRKPKQYLTAVDHVSLDVCRGDTLGLVGESGCGKSTLAKTVIGLYKPSAGRVVFAGAELTAMSRKELRKNCNNIQMVFQDPYSSLNPRMSVRAALREELKVHKMCPPSEINARIAELLEMVGLSEQQAAKLPSAFSGGQRQRIGIARALALNPQIIIADEPVSALDVSIQAQVINLLIELQQKLGLTVLFISHDLRVVRYISNRVAVMYLGRIMEMGETDELFEYPLHPYTGILLKAAPKMTSDARNTKSEAIHGDPPSPIHLPSGCRFHPRCPYVMEACRTQEPELREIRPGHYCACWHPLLKEET
ncbi:Oligopeptide transport ATP-binding protein OppF [bioreactor metagenome]|uniref:Oligopeptide transport ATP-binding protein OppF n=1 Tax=bioreactor metagenome TaxID=1076179 RepID=A0A644WEW9_9ZZZZ